MTDEELYLQKRFKELGEKSWICSQFFFTGFLSVSDISLLHDTCDRSGIKYTLWGGAENTERDKTEESVQPSKVTGVDVAS